MRHSKKPAAALSPTTLLVQVLRLAAVAVLFAWLIASIAGFQTRSGAMAGAEHATAPTAPHASRA